MIVVNVELIQLVSVIGFFVWIDPLPVEVLSSCSHYDCDFGCSMRRIEGWLCR